MDLFEQRCVDGRQMIAADVDLIPLTRKCQGYALLMAVVVAEILGRAIGIHPDSEIANMHGDGRVEHELIVHRPLADKPIDDRRRISAIDVEDVLSELLRISHAHAAVAEEPDGTH